MYLQIIFSEPRRGDAFNVVAVTPGKV